MRARLSHYSGFVRSVSTKKLLICGLPLPTAHRQATHIHIYTHARWNPKPSQGEIMPKQIKQMKISQPQNQVKTHRQIVRVLVRGEGEGGRGVALTVVWVPQMLCLIGISWVLSCCSLATLNVVLVLVFIFVCVLAA